MDGTAEDGLRTPLRTLAAEEFVRRLRAYTTSDSAEAQYALFIGAGCSISSGVPGATTLVQERWIPRLRDVAAPDEDDALEWAKRELGIETDPLPPGAYGRIMTELLPYPALRQAEVEDLCGSGRPGFGYATLAQLMANTGSRFNVVLTTNFDDLVADALYLFTGVHPLLIHHGALSPFIRATRTRPLVVKLHGHHQFSALNTQEETQQIEPGLAAGVRSLLHDRGLIFLGYSGSDDGIREVLAGLPPEALPYGVFWVSGAEPAGSIRPWLDKRKAFWVKHQGFDELMVHVRDVFGLPMPNTKHVEEVFQAVQQNYLSLSEQIRSRTGTGPEEVALKDAAERVDRTVRDWAVYELRAQRSKRSNPERAKAAYQEGLAVLPDSVPLLGNFANFLKDLNELNEAEKHYLRALELDPANPVVLHDYAIFLWRYLGMEDKASDYFDRATDVDPGDDAVRLSNYANFAWEVRKDIARAERMFQRAVSLSSVTPEPFRQYALFAQLERRNYRLADDLYHEALQRKPDDVATLVNYSSLAALSGDIGTAGQLLERAYAVDEDDPNVSISLARFLWRHRIDYDRAHALFDQARSRKPRYAREVRRYAMVLLEYAWFLAEVPRAIDEGWELIGEASGLLPEDSFILAAQASYMAHKMKQPEAALKLIDDAIFARGENGDLLGAKANVIQQEFGDRETAERLYRQALELEPDAPDLEVNLAAILFAEGNAKEALPLCLDAIRRVGRSEPNVAIECFFLLFAHGPAEDRSQALRILKWLATEKVRSPGWDLSPNVKRAIVDGHPSAEWLPRLAAVIADAEDISLLSGWLEWEQLTLPSLVPVDRVTNEVAPHLLQDWSAAR